MMDGWWIKARLMIPVIITGAIVVVFVGATPATDDPACTRLVAQIKAPHESEWRRFTDVNEQLANNPACYQDAYNDRVPELRQWLESLLSAPEPVKPNAAPISERQMIRGELPKFVLPWTAPLLETGLHVSPAQDATGSRCLLGLLKIGPKPYQQSIERYLASLTWSDVATTDLISQLGQQLDKFGPILQSELWVQDALSPLIEQRLGKRAVAPATFAPTCAWSQQSVRWQELCRFIHQEQSRERALEQQRTVDARVREVTRVNRLLSHLAVALVSVVLALPFPRLRLFLAVPLGFYAGFWFGDWWGRQIPSHSSHAQFIDLGDFIQAMFLLAFCAVVTAVAGALLSRKRSLAGVVLSAVVLVLAAFLQYSRGW